MNKKAPTLDELRDALADRNLSIVSKKTGIHYNTLRNLATGQTEPQYETARILIDYLRSTEV